jgi:hypothetical protein
MTAWRQLPESNRRWLVVNALFVTAAINVLVNGAIDLLTVANRDAVPMWGLPLVEPSVFWTLIGTLFLLPLFTSALSTAAIRRDIGRGSMARLDHLASTHPGIARLPAGRWRRGAAVGGIAVAVLAPPLVVLLALLGSPDLSAGQFVAYQVIFAVLLGVLVTPPIALAAMAE